MVRAVGFERILKPEIERSRRRIYRAAIPCGLSSNTVPAPEAPAYLVVPYRLPAASGTKPPSGLVPSAPPAKLHRTLSLPPASTSNTVPAPEAPPPQVAP